MDPEVRKRLSGIELTFAQLTTSLQDIVDSVDEHFKALPAETRYETVFITGPTLVPDAEVIDVGFRKEDGWWPWDEPHRLRASYSLAQILQTTQSRGNRDLTKMRLIIPKGQPSTLILCADE
ncbi:MAG: hypothetical protein ABR884_03190 [Minisyncoccia bacterium]|jgi:hypothetical protein